MTITDFIKGNIILVAVVIVILYFIVRYLYNKGHFDKFGIKDINLSNPTNNDFFKTDNTIKQPKEDFFATGPEIKKIGDDDYFDTNFKDTKTKKWFEDKK
jgi:hypothetical protein